LSAQDQRQLLWESSYFSKQIAVLFEADKLNVASLGNMVPQLHVHHIVRYQTDAAWPAPVWGQVAAIAYDADQLAVVSDKVRSALTEQFQTAD
jgi:diadenosine tetraphosphate (Ap4A) HIT family hydrolase